MNQFKIKGEIVGINLELTLIFHIFRCLVSCATLISLHHIWIIATAKVNIVAKNVAIGKK